MLITHSPHVPKLPQGAAGEPFGRTQQYELGTGQVSLNFVLADVSAKYVQ